MQRIYMATGAGGGKQKETPPQTQKQTKPKKK